MNKTRTLFFLLAIITIVLTISACGVSEEEYENTLADLSRTKSELEQAKSRIAELEESLALPKTDAELVEKLYSAQQKVSELSSSLKSLTIENQTLRENLEKTGSSLKEPERELKTHQDQTRTR
jgi:chromosome segregation ATPase